MKTSALISLLSVSGVLLLGTEACSSAPGAGEPGSIAGNAASVVAAPTAVNKENVAWTRAMTVTFHHNHHVYHRLVTMRHLAPKDTVRTRMLVPLSGSPGSHDEVCPQGVDDERAQDS